MIIGKPTIRAIQHEAEKCTKICEASSMLTTSTLNVPALWPERAAMRSNKLYVGKSGDVGAIITWSKIHGIAINAPIARIPATRRTRISTARRASRWSQKLICSAVALLIRYLLASVFFVSAGSSSSSGLSISRRASFMP